MYADDELTYVNQLESTNEGYRLAQYELEATLHKQDKTIDRLSAEIGMLRDMILKLVEQKLYPLRHVS